MLTDILIYLKDSWSTSYISVPLKFAFRYKDFE